MAQAWVFALRGELDHASAVQLEEAAERLYTAVPEPGLVVVDCSGLEFCDSSGIGWLVRMHLRLAARGGALRLAAVPASVARVFSLTGLDQAIPAHPTAWDAVAAVGADGAGAPELHDGETPAPSRSASER
ncbi:STAS domain-containing protein [Streptomyces sp. NPDC048182]|uniref:STAS domain-containing protein n=1 Tax=Streptomyces sp. NPDC048182 TaxID=3365507 RepID=UPI0037217529